MPNEVKLLPCEGRDFVERLKADPENVANQLLALTRISDRARVAHRSNFDGYLIAAAELLARPTIVTDECSWCEGVREPGELCACNTVVTDEVVEPTEVPIETIWALGDVIRHAEVDTPLGPRSVGYYLSVGLDHFNHPHDRFQGLLNAAARAAIAAMPAIVGGE